MKIWVKQTIRALWATNQINFALSFGRIEMTTSKHVPGEKRVVVLQSNYLPWKGYFDLIRSADLLVFYDDTQFTKNDWRNRNLIVTPRGLEWISIPCGQRIHRIISDVKPTNSRWQRSHWDKIVQSYHSAPYFKIFKDFFEDFYLARPWNNLSELNQHLIRTVATQFLDIHTPTRLSTEFTLTGSKEDRLVDLLEQVGATHYLSGPTGRSFLSAEPFEEAGISLEWMNYNGYPEYEQRNSPFVHQVSVIDLLFNTGPAAGEYLNKQSVHAFALRPETVSVFN